MVLLSIQSVVRMALSENGFGQVCICMGLETLVVGKVSIPCRVINAGYLHPAAVSTPEIATIHQLGSRLYMVSVNITFATGLGGTSILSHRSLRCLAPRSYAAK